MLQRSITRSILNLNIYQWVEIWVGIGFFCAEHATNMLRDKGEVIRNDLGELGTSINSQGKF